MPSEQAKRAAEAHKPGWKAVEITEESKRISESLRSPPAPGMGGARFIVGGPSPVAELEAAYLAAFRRLEAAAPGAAERARAKLHAPSPTPGADDMEMVKLANPNPTVPLTLTVLVQNGKVIGSQG